MEGENTNNGNTNTSINNNTTVVYDNISAINGINPSPATSLCTTFSAVFGMLALICMISALAVNDISGNKLSIDNSYGSWSYKATCKWNEYRIVGEYTSSSLNSNSDYSYDVSFHYQYYCEEGKYTPDIPYFCQAYKSGAVFVAFGISSIIFSTCAILAVISQARVQSCVNCIFLTCYVFVFIALIVWSTVNTDGKNDEAAAYYFSRSCFDTGNKDNYIGPSYILYVIGGTFYLVAFLMTFSQPKYKKSIFEEKSLLLSNGNLSDMSLSSPHLANDCIPALPDELYIYDNKSGGENEMSCMAVSMEMSSPVIDRPVAYVDDPLDAL